MLRREFATMKTITSLRKQHGLSLVEIMVALTISLLLLAGVVQIFTSSKQAYRNNESLARVQENGRFAIDLLSSDLRMGGFWGCAQVESDSFRNNLNPAGAGFIDVKTVPVVDGTEGGTTDQLVLRGAQGTALTLQAALTTLTDDVTVPVNNGLEPDDWVVISDCHHADLFQITSDDPNGSGTLAHAAGSSGATPPAGPGNLTSELSYRYDTTARVFRAVEARYFVAAGASGEPALFRQFTGSAAQELVEGVETFNLTFGEDTDLDNVPNYFVPRAAVTDPNRITAVRANLVVRSAETNVAPAAAGGDRRIRHTFSTTVSLRNQNF